MSVLCRKGKGNLLPQRFFQLHQRQYFLSNLKLGAHTLISAFTTWVIDGLRWPVPRPLINHLYPFVSEGLCLRNSELAPSFPHSERLQSFHWTRRDRMKQPQSSTFKVVRYQNIASRRSQGYLPYSPSGKRHSLPQDGRGDQKHPEVPDGWEDNKGSEWRGGAWLAKKQELKALLLFPDIYLHSSHGPGVPLGLGGSSWADSNHRPNFSMGLKY